MMMPKDKLGLSYRSHTIPSKLDDEELTLLKRVKDKTGLSTRDLLINPGLDNVRSLDV